MVNTIVPLAYLREQGMTDLVPAKDLEFRGVTSTRTALTFEHDMSPELWDALLKHIMVHRNAANWWMGDALNKGEELFGEEMPQWVEDALGSKQTVNNVMRVCRVFEDRPGEKTRRREDLSFSHHMEVAGLRESTVQDRFLQLAANKGWDRDQLRSAVRDHKQELGLLRKRNAPEPVEDAETVEEEPAEPLAREPEVIEGKAEEVTPETPEEPFDDAESVVASFMKLDPGSQKAVLLRCAEHVRLLLTHEEETEIQEVADLVDEEQNSPDGCQLEEGNASGSTPDPSEPLAHHGGVREGASALPNAGGAPEAREQSEAETQDDGRDALAGEVTRPSPPPAPDPEEGMEIPEFLRRDREVADA